MTKFYVYIIESSNGNHYIGQTSDLERRLDEHNSGVTKSTKNRGVWKLIASKQVVDRTEAMKLEWKLKKLKNWKKAKKYLSDFESGFGS